MYIPDTYIKKGDWKTFKWSAKQRLFFNFVYVSLWTSERNLVIFCPEHLGGFITPQVGKFMGGKPCLLSEILFLNKGWEETQ
jgi:uncharacterized protein YbbK (DUF523 family)